jgi:hypothetical protein
MPSRTDWKTGTCCRNWRDYADPRPVSNALATHDCLQGGLSDALEFLKRTRWELRQLRRVRVWKDRLCVYDVNKDYFEVRGIGYADPDIVPLLQMVNTAFNPETIHHPIDAEYKEFDTGRRHPWAEDRVM